LGQPPIATVVVIQLQVRMPCAASLIEILMHSDPAETCSLS
jgi:hypothetical protein